MSLLVLLPLLGGPTAAVVGRPAEPGGIALVLAPPWVGADRVVHAAGGRVIGPVSAPFAVLAVSEQGDFQARLRASGAWAVADGQPIASICGVSV